MSKGSFDEELAYFEEHRKAWFEEHPNEFAVVKHCELIGIFPTLGEAYGAGLARLGNVEMLIKEILEKEPRYRLRTVIG